MKKILFFAAAMLCVTAANAKVWRINYDANANADFRTITAACAAAKVADTDTLYCEAGYHIGNESDNTISRSGMTVVGPGWGYAPNYGNTSTIAEASFSNTITINANNVRISGIVCKNLISLTNVTRSGCTIDRCKVKQIYWTTSNFSNRFLENIIIKNCFITNNINIDLVNSNTNCTIHNINIENNILVYGGSPVIRIAGTYIDDYASNMNIMNNTIIGTTTSTSNPIIKTVNSLIQDNIIINTANETFVMDFNQTGNIIRKNVFSLSPDNVSTVISEKYPDNYYVGATIDNTFVNTTTGGYYDEAMKYKILETSPAKGGAYDGGDCGAFGGASPYVLNGRPQGIPYIYDVEVPAQPKDNKLHVTFKVANQNE